MISDQEFDEKYLGKHFGGKRGADGRWSPSGIYQEMHRGLFTGTNATLDKDGEPITLDSLRAHLDECKRIISMSEEELVAEKQLKEQISTMTTAEPTEVVEKS